MGIPQKNSVPLCLSLVAGVVCILLAYLWLSSFTPSLTLTLLPHGRQILLRFSNTGNDELRFEPVGLEYMVLYPENDSGDYVVIVKNSPVLSVHERPLREPLVAVLQPGEFRDVADIAPLLQGLPQGKATLEAVYDADRDDFHFGLWQGTARAMPIPMSIR